MQDQARVAPPDTDALAEAKARKHRELRVAFNAATSSGFLSSAVGSPHLYRLDPPVWAALAESAAQVYGTRGIECVNPVVDVRPCSRLHTCEQLFRVLADRAARQDALIHHRHALSEQIAAADSLETLDAVPAFEPTP